MLAYAIRRFGQSFVVLVLMSFLVFVGVYAIGNPVELLVNPQADEVEPTDHGEPGPGLRNPSAVIGAAIAGDYSLACRAFGQPASSPASPRRLSIDRDGRMRVDDIEVAGPSSRGSLQIGAFAGKQPSVLHDH